MANTRDLTDWHLLTLRNKTLPGSAPLTTGLTYYQGALYTDFGTPVRYNGGRPNKRFTEQFDILHTAVRHPNPGDCYRAPEGDLMAQYTGNGEWECYLGKTSTLPQENLLHLVRDLGWHKA